MGLRAKEPSVFSSYHRRTLKGVSSNHERWRQYFERRLSQRPGARSSSHNQKGVVVGRFSNPGPRLAGSPFRTVNLPFAKGGGKGVL